MSDTTTASLKKRARVIEALEAGLSVASGAKAAGINRTTLWRWRRDNPEFAAAVEEALEEGTDKVEDALMEKALAMDDHASVTAAIFLLKARRPEKYRERPHMDVMAKDQTKIVVEFVTAAPAQGTESSPGK